ncbi:integrase repeat-containing protein [Deinococcus altitudinis]|uniref:integrase repeat-containing protein n=1 Tax=Deinococcus altitudinis TaxID=468914 RepID=UPI0038913967
MMLSLDQAKAAVRVKGWKTRREYLSHWHKVADLPEAPQTAYPDWPGWRAFLTIEFLSYSAAQEVVRQAGIANAREYVAKYRDHLGLPSAPADVYEEWVDWQTFLGHMQETRFLSYEDAAAVVRAAGVASFRDYARVYRRYLGLPSTPNKAYVEWEGWGPFLNIKVPTYAEAQEIVKSLNIKTAAEYTARYREHLGLPSSPYKLYVEWEGWPVFLGRRESNRDLTDVNEGAIGPKNVRKM